MILNNFILEADRHSLTYICKECREPHYFSSKAQQPEIDRELAAHSAKHNEQRELKAA
jgi:hypothetical protein